ncbi:hypothetical protein HBI67_099290 [Parastagonospora nodorum]|nr:hypothetical protein HBH50_121400 [Parastagonospora nodorum]KAH4085756.1 hypothetical protein HBH48_153760 [Parastagonospora nodorum]KAH4963063.1 hypothetical protein HBI78_125620 [Parastagonospora nodorum]KAH4983735.1 hypothetical protein HBI76_146630 [Parastagonospora nodorum]KAH5470654.1 hypothetical protein HBI28_157160 [Parastagonospora nodorum]
MPSIISANFGALSGLSDLKGRTKKTLSGPDQVKSRKRTDMVAHIACVRRSIAVAPPSTVYRNKHFMPCAVLDTSTVSTAFSLSEVHMTNRTKIQTSSQLLRDVKVAWDKAAAHARTQKYVDELSATAVNPIDVDAQSTLPPDNASEPSSETTETGKDASYDSQAETAQKLTDLQRLVEQKGRDCEEMHAQCEQSGLEVQEFRGNYAILDKKYKAQLAQRVNDKAMVDEAQQHCDAVDENYAKLEAKFDAIKNGHGQTIKQLQAQLKMNDQEKAKLQDSHRCAIAVLQDSHKKDLAKKIVEVEQALSLFTLKQEALKSTKRELLRVAEVADSNRKVWAQEKQDFEFRAEVSDASALDTIGANESEIMRLTERNRILEDEVQLLSFPDRAHSKEVLNAITNSAAIRKEIAEERRELMVAKEKLENTLESIHTDREIFGADQKKETEARVHAHELKRQVDTLQQKLVLREDAIRGMELRKVPSDLDRKDVLGSNLGMMVFVENDSLQTQLKGLEQEKQEVQTKYNKLDDENLDLLIRISDIEKLANDDKTELEVLRAYKAFAEKELEVVPGVWKQKGSAVSKDSDELRRYLRDTTGQIQLLSQQAIEMGAELDEKRECITRVEDEADTKCRKFADETDFWTGLYFDEAVPHVERLYGEIKALNIELGRYVEPKERHVRNKRVEERAVLRNACKYTMKGVDTAKIPAEYYEPGFVPGVVAATYDAMRFLRPRGWIPLYNRDKVYYQPMYKPFTEEDAAARLEAQQQKEKEKQDRVAQEMLGAIIGMYPRSSCSINDANISSARKNKPTQDRPTPPCEVAPSSRLVPRQILDRPIANKPLTGPAFSVMKRPNMQAKKGRYVEQPPSTPAYAVNGPPWESRYADFQGMTEEDYEEMDPGVKQYFVDGYLKGRRA